ncbi:lytic transglycosylase domain-containing protein [Alphaproteobacteria bacterium KMM 3653]|uniref:Lytic transglycosylase domain-containing protein n=1 Tax=Harenicola maris TaxID=2841044 RepID=A0AAP2CT04_9RHOB|nr:lytic transglycosylase domain-containing protein [Harenicola maris]
MSFRLCVLALFAVVCAVLSGGSPAAAQGRPALAEAIAQARGGDYPAALETAPEGAARDVIRWMRLRDGLGSWAEYREFMTRNAHWPGLASIRARGERAIPDGVEPQEVLDFFGGDLPQTGRGVLAVVRAHLAREEQSEAEAVAVLAWRSRDLTPATEDALLEAFPELLAEHNAARLDDLLWRGKTEAANRMLPRLPASYASLATARRLLRNRSNNEAAAVRAVDKAHVNDPGLAHARFNHRARNGKNADAIALLEQYSTSPADLGRPESWANWRRILARAELRRGRAAVAYRLASQHFLLAGSNYADLEWLSGFIALRYLDDAELALLHFDRFREAVETPISLGRAGYWRGRAYRALGDEAAAQEAYAFGALFQTSFYGQLAAEAIDMPLDPLAAGKEVFPTLAESGLAQNTVFQASEALLASGERNLAEWYLTHLTETLSREHAGTLGDWALAQGDEHIALKIAKQAARNGHMIHASYFPLHSLKDGPWPVPPELALAIARRESEFDPVVVSPAGAQGLMQVMPGTARDVARELGITYSKSRLTTDPLYNARLGTAYLDGLIEVFGYSPVLISVGYNAGPGRSVSWIADRGDPRDEGIDVIDWIELIPFRETRNYVMRVSESLPLYRARLSGTTGEVGLTKLLRGAYPVARPKRPVARPAGLSAPQVRVSSSAVESAVPPVSVVVPATVQTSPRPQSNPRR